MHHKLLNNISLLGVQYYKQRELNSVIFQNIFSGYGVFKL